MIEANPGDRVEFLFDRKTMSGIYLGPKDSKRFEVLLDKKDSGEEHKVVFINVNRFVKKIEKTVSVVKAPRYKRSSKSKSSFIHSLHEAVTIMRSLREFSNEQLPDDVIQDLIKLGDGLNSYL